MSNKKPPFFVGYLGFPSGLKPFMRTLVPVVLATGLGVAAITGIGTRDAGQGQWQAQEEVPYEGLLSLSPYPMLHLADGSGRTILITRTGKKPAAELLKGLDGIYVRMEGFEVRRGGWTMLELNEPASINSFLPFVAVTKPEPRPIEAVSLKGEIVDSKCLLGVMKPGEGKVHRACASLCLLGGMPPMLLVKTPSGDKAAYLLVGPNGEAVGADMASMVAEPVRVSGQLERWGNMPVIRLSGTPSRLSGDDLIRFGGSVGVGDSAEAGFCVIPS